MSRSALSQCGRVVRVWVIFAATCLALPLGAAGPLDGQARAVDGDGLRFGSVSVRIAGIDAPERGQPCIRPDGRVFDCGEAMRDALAQDVRRFAVSCRDTGERSYDRVVGRCTLGGQDLGAYLISAGRARAHPDHASSQYFELEKQAAVAGLGLWAYQMSAPWEYRAAARAATAPNPGPQSRSDCSIKGNISSKGERIYHAPGQRHYEKVRISPRKGERCFASEAEARAAGWRRARR